MTAGTVFLLGVSLGGFFGVVIGLILGGYFDHVPFSEFRPRSIYKECHRPDNDDLGEPPQGSGVPIKNQKSKR